MTTEHTDDPVLETLKFYTVGFLKQLMNADGSNRRLTPCGSGVLAEIGGVKGAITAAHVIKEVKASPVAALFTITHKKTKAVPLEFGTAQLESTFVGHPPWSSSGPDLGFVRFPYAIEAALVNENVFYNFDKRLDLAQTSEAEETPLTDEVICGVVAEKSVEKLVGPTTRVDEHTMVLAYGTSINHRMSETGFDLFDLTPLHNDDVTRPNSYGGLSGGAVWRTDGTTNVNSRLVFGVCFWENEPDSEGVRTIVCHGPESIYTMLANQVRKVFKPV